MRNLNLDQLRTFVEVAELGNFSAAARRLNLTQPAVSVQIKELEARLGVSLIKRVGKQAYPTAAGRDLIDHANLIFASTDGAMAAMRRHNDGSIGRVHIGSGPAALRYLLLPVLQRLRAEHPDIDLAVSTGNTADITERLSRNAVDIGFTGLPVDSALFEARAVRVMDMVAIMPADDRDIPSVVTPQDIAERSLIVTPQRSNHAHLARDWLRGAGLDIRPAMEIDDIEAIKQVVAAGLGVAIIPSEAISRGDPVAGLAVRPLHPPPTLTLGLICRRQTPHDPALTIVCDAIMTLAEEPSDPVVRAANPSSPPTAPGDPAAAVLNRAPTIGDDN